MDAYYPETHKIITWR